MYQLKRLCWTKKRHISLGFTASPSGKGLLSSSFVSDKI